MKIIMKNIVGNIKVFFLNRVKNKSHTLTSDIIELFATYILNIGYYMLHIFPQRNEVQRMKKLNGIREGKQCFVFANGPSMNLLDSKKILKYQQSGFDVICMNSYIISDMAKMIIPDYYVLSDPASFFASNRLISDDVMETQEKQNKVLNELNIPLFMPAEYSNLNLFKNYYIFYNFGNRFKSYVNPLKPRGYPTTTAHKALTIACYLGYDEIYICGFDHDFIKNILVDENNNPYFLINHYYDPEIKTKITHETGKNVSILLWEQHQLFKNLERFKKYNIINLDKNGLVDAFSKKHNLDIYVDH